MKQAKHNENLKAFSKKALKEGKGVELAQLDPLRALVRGILSYDVGDAKADEALATIDREFCELNEIRVATELELHDMLGVRYPDIERRAFRLIAILNMIFEREHTLSLERVRLLGKKEARQFLRELPEMTPYIEAYTLLHGLESAAIPVDDELLILLTEFDAVAPDTTHEEAQRALENLLKSEEHAEFHAGARKLISERKKKK
jgi:endonuclease III